ncbi:MAG: response regulator transcription factor [Bacteroidetes bacterium]|nr:response regulator transcription factor [Rhodothermia bacterium]MCS7154833.1 response regulator transcription factor [Bacteroidota bacterium]MCX7907009.1 response regulator transcription factor [Bacteroidota bacterium]MDW8137627.1 response regulator transcription factor [Bacteroidota bacterium]MDW8285419.1 response regulator transcription factor [Bacteroidota bacterium]
MAAKVLLVDDEPDLLEFLRYNLEKAGYTVLTAFDGASAMRIAEAEKPDVVVLDIMMPHLDGLAVCERLRAHPELRHVPIAFLTARNTETDEIMGLEAGADDYIPKPVSPALLLSHIRALLRRSVFPTNAPRRIRIHDLEIDRDRYTVRQGATEHQLPRKEFELLFFLASRPGVVFSRQELLDHVWGTDVYVVDRTVDVHVRKIRERLGSHYIETIKGVGYRFRAP